MLDGAAILAKVQSKEYPSSWLVARARGWNFIASGALLLLAYYIIINDASSKSSQIAKYVPFPTLTWTVPTGSGFLLTVVVLTAVLVGLIWQYLRQRQRVLVFMPDGFIKANLRTGAILQQVTYSSIDTVALRDVPEDAFEPVPHVRLELITKLKQQTLWRVEDYYSISAAEIARNVFIGCARALTKPNLDKQEQDAGELSPEEVVAMVRQGQVPEHWRVFEQKLPLKAYAGPIFVIGVGIFFIGAFINSYFIAGPSLPQRFNSGRPFGDVLAGELVSLFAVVLIPALIVSLEYVFWRKVRISHMTFIITQTKWVVAGKRSGKVMQVLPFAAVPSFKLSYWYKSYTLRYQSPDGKRHVIVMAADSLKSPAYVCQSFLFRYAQQRISQGIL